jgi:Tol biopolymer transport system component
VQIVPAPQPLAPAAPPDARGGWRLLYAQGGDLWETGKATLTQLTRVGTIEQPALDDTSLAFVERGRNASDVWVVSSDTPPQAVTRNASSSVSQSNWVSEPAFVTGEPRLYVLSDFNKTSTGAGDLAIWQLNIQTGAVLQLTHPPAYTGGDQDIAVNPTNPRQIIFTRYSYDGPQLIEQLEWLDTNVENAVTLTGPDHSARQASISPDGTQVAYIQQGGGANQDLFVGGLVVDKNQPQLVNVQQVASGVIANPAWSPDGGRLAYLALAGDRFQIYAVDVQLQADGSETFGDPRQITSGAGVDSTSRPIFLTPDQADQVQQWLGALQQE